MSDLRSYEIEDLVWDEFSLSEDHIVPHSAGEEASDDSFPEGSRKKPCREFVGIPGNAREQSADRSACQRKTQESTTPLDDRRNIMLEKESWAHTPNGVFPSLSDSNSAKEVSILASDGTRISNHGFDNSNSDLIGSGYCTTDSMLIDKGAAADNNSYNYPLGHIPQADNDIIFFDDNQNEKESSDFLYYGWPDIGNFEDVDRMFRSCDSTFGLGASSEDELGWFTSSDAMEGSGNMLNSEFEPPCPAASTMEQNSEKHDPVRTNGTYSTISGSGIKSALGSCEDNSWNKDDPANIGQLSFADGTGSSENTGSLRPRKQGVELKREVLHKISAANGSRAMANATKKQQKHQARPETKRKSSYFGQGGSFYYDVCPPNEEKGMPSEATSHLTLPPGGIIQQKQDLGSESFGFMQNNYPYLQADYSLSDHNSSFPGISPIKSNHHGQNIPSKESSYSSNQVVSAQSSHNPAFQVTSAVPLEETEKQQPKQAYTTMFSDKPTNGEIGDRVAVCGQNSGNQLENQKVEKYHGEYGYQEGSSVSSAVDEASLEATSFRQLQLVMEQLDVKTKLCIRDSLYRLARSAEQRHNHTHMKGSCCGDDLDTNGELLAEGTNKCNALMDIETDTNPIDRSIAHLLFHRPSDSGSLSFKPPSLVR
ncbi:OLC1v1002613C3 [Oldenlandia corymbosa var. corymbosa]|uniref:OLC1v1002613C3 n=1 Tax=Oldenlandia corymbosa var. corymbosa TaxID=529605 RepID=A0AAV1DAE3_OLDCO|nr:OLC1v1002613C3 [Oldenlandia corymbosa var. corymbosa]